MESILAKDQRIQNSRTRMHRSASNTDATRGAEPGSAQAFKRFRGMEMKGKNLHSTMPLPFPGTAAENRRCEHIELGSAKVHCSPGQEKNLASSSSSVQQPVPPSRRDTPEPGDKASPTGGQYNS